MIDFNAIASGESITNQFGGLGVTFSGNPFQGDPFPASTLNGTPSAANHNPINVPISAFFTAPQNRVGMFFGGQVGIVNTMEIRAFLGVAEVDVQTFVTGGPLPGGNIPAVFGGIEVLGGFDRIEFQNLSGNQAFQIDDFRFESVARMPEPHALALIGFGLAALGASRRRR